VLSKTMSHLPLHSPKSHCVPLVTQGGTLDRAERRAPNPIQCGTVCSVDHGSHSSDMLIRKLSLAFLESRSTSSSGNASPIPIPKSGLHLEQHSFAFPDLHGSPNLLGGRLKAGGDACQRLFWSAACGYYLVPRDNVFVAPFGGSFVMVVWKTGTSPHFIAHGAEKLRNETEGRG
jgi:hypothetical protein